MNNTRLIKTFIGAMIVAATVAAGYASTISHMTHSYLAWAVLALAMATSRMRVKLPGINGNMSMNLPFLLTAAIALSGAEAVAIALLSTVVQCWPRNRASFKPEQMAFNLATMSFAAALASLASHATWLSHLSSNSNALGLILAAMTLFLGQTAPVAGVVAVSESKKIGAIWWALAHLSFPYYVVSAGITSMVEAVGVHLGWGLALGVFPVMYGIYRSYRVYFGRIADSVRSEVLVRAAGAGSSA